MAGGGAGAGGGGGGRPGGYSGHGGFGGHGGPPRPEPPPYEPWRKEVVGSSQQVLSGVGLAAPGSSPATLASAESVSVRTKVIAGIQFGTMSPAEIVRASALQVVSRELYRMCVQVEGEGEGWGVRGGSGIGGRVGDGWGRRGASPTHSQRVNGTAIAPASHAT